MKSKAFTLIELLVVIAIIAILAAILFPVFAQAKVAAKKAAMISNMKQVASSLIMYAGDADDMLPFALTPDTSNNTVRRTGGHAVPAGWISDSRYKPQEDAMGWANSTNPYRKNYDLLRLDVAPVERISGLPYTGAQRWKDTSVTLNGLLHSYPLSGIEATSRLAMLWLGWGLNNHAGIMYVNPRLNCRGTGPCRFNPGGYPQPDMSDGSSRGDEWNTSASMWVFGRGQTMAASDTSAKYRPMGSNPGGNVASGDGNEDPFGLYDTKGVPVEMWRCYAAGAAVRYGCFFRPDNAFGN